MQQEKGNSMIIESKQPRQLSIILLFVSIACAIVCLALFGSYRIVELNMANLQLTESIKIGPFSFCVRRNEPLLSSSISESPPISRVIIGSNMILSGRRAEYEHGDLYIRLIDLNRMLLLVEANAEERDCALRNASELFLNCKDVSFVLDDISRTIVAKDHSGITKSVLYKPSP